MIMTRCHCRLPCVLALSLAGLMAGCVDLRNDITSGTLEGNSIEELEPWPAADETGVIVVGGRRYAEAMAGETLVDLARRVGEDPYTLSDVNNGIHVNRRLSKGTIVRLPVIHQTVSGPGQVASPVTGEAVQGGNYIRHTVRPGETLYTIAEIYSISVRTLAEWNGLQADFAVKSGTVLVVPVRQPENRPTAEPRTAGAPVTEPPAPPPAALPQSANEPPVTTPAAPEPAIRVAEPAVDTETPSAAEEISEATESQFTLPMEGTVREEYLTSSGHDGLDIAATPGTEIFAVADGRIALVSGLTDKSTIVLVRHPNDIYSVYQHITGVTLKKGDAVTMGEKIAVLAEKPGYLHFEVREGTVGVDPRRFLPPGSYSRE